MMRLETDPVSRRNDVVALFDQAMALFQGGRLAEAKRIARRVLANQPKHAQALHLLGVALSQQGNHTEALRFIDAARQIEGQSASIYNSRGNVLVTLQRFDEAVASYDKAIALKSDFPEAFCNRGGVLQELKRFDEALASYDKAIALKPNFAEAFCNRGLTLQELNRFDEALASYDKAIALTPDYAEAFCSRGATLQALRRLDEALVSYDQAIALKSDFADAFCNRGAALQKLKRLDEALASYDQAIALKPDYADGYRNRALARLLMGRYHEGWKDNEWRWEAKDFPSKRPNIRVPTWQGEELSGRHLLVFSEQGLGDAIQFVRYLPLLAERKCKITFLAPANLARLLRPSIQPVEIIDALGTAEGIDFQIALMSLPHRFNTELASIPSRVPYLKAEPELEARWKALLSTTSKPGISRHGCKVGIAWSGSAEHKNDHNRSIPLSSWLPVLDVPITFVSLQKDVRSDDAELLKARKDILRFDGELTDFAETAGLISQLDLVISVDTSVAHLAGALGKPVWLLLPFVPDWRWLLDREDSPWYPSLRLFRQPQRDDWSSVFAKIEQELRAPPKREARQLIRRGKADFAIAPSRQIK
jgi:tetratricopeptide (TPR) repeat protein